MTIYTALRDRGFLTRCAETLEEFVAFVDEFCRDWPYTYDAWCEGPELDAASFCAARDEAIAAGRVMTTHRGKHHASRAHQVGPFPSGATLKTSGDKIVGRVEAHGGGSGGISRDPLPDSDVWRGIGHKEHDTFGPDFIVTKGAVEVTPTPSPTTDSAYPAIAGLLRG